MFKHKGSLGESSTQRLETGNIFKEPGLQWVFTARSLRDTSLSVLADTVSAGAWKPLASGFAALESL